jgi:dihydrofolate synthase/folylpolyglutamate synthase
MGGEWDATNIMAAEVAVVAPIDLDHTALLGNTIAEIAAEKAGIIKAGSRAVLAAQSPEAARVLLARCAEVGVEVRREGIEFGLIDRTPAVGGQVLRLETADGPLGDVVLPLYGAHMAQNAALALAAVEAFLGGRALPADAVADGFAAVKAPARLELVRTSPSVLLDTCHNPHGARATMAAVEEAFAFEPLIGIVAMMADKDVNAVLGVFAEAMSTVVCTTIAGTPRAMPAVELATRAGDVFGPHRVLMADNLEDAIEQAVTLADQSGPTAGILIAGSVYAAGQARSLLVHADED